MKLEKDRAGYAVCTMARLSYLPGPTVSYIEGDFLDPVDDAPPYEIFCQQLRDLCKQWDRGFTTTDWYSSEEPVFPKLACVLAVTGDIQSKSEEYLERIGFVRNGPFEKIKHPDSRLSVWVCEINQFCKSIGYISKHDPRTAEERGY